MKIRFYSPGATNNLPVLRSSFLSPSRKQIFFRNILQTDSFKIRFYLEDFCLNFLVNYLVGFSYIIGRLYATLIQVFEDKQGREVATT